MNGTRIDPSTIGSHSRWGENGDSEHPCSLIDGQRMRYEEAGMCRQHWSAVSGEIGEINFNASYTVLMNNATGLEIIPGVQGALNDVNVMAVTSNEATVDTNGDGQIWVGNEVNAETPDLWGQFNLSIEACADKSCDPDEGGRREIDMVIATKDEILFVEQKHWSGSFTITEEGHLRLEVK